MRSVAVFAHNEEAEIARSLRAVLRAGLGPEDRVTVLVNGSRDCTTAIAYDMAAADPRIAVEVIALGDKSNAWNLYAQRLAPLEAELHVFIDGDVRVSEGSFDLMAQALARHPEALAASAFPRGGRQSARWGERILRHHGLPGNFYALRGETLRSMRGRAWLPVGLIGDDTLLRLLLLRDLDPQATPVPERIRPVEGAFFDYESFALSRPSDLRSLWRRQVRYTLREVQMHALWQRLEARGLAALPLRIDEVYPDIRPLADARAVRVGFRGRRALVPWVAASSQRLVARPLSAAPWYEVVP